MYTKTKKGDKNGQKGCTHGRCNPFFGQFCYNSGLEMRFLSKRWAQKSSKAIYIYIYIYTYIYFLLESHFLYPAPHREPGTVPPLLGHFRARKIGAFEDVCNVLGFQFLIN